MEPRFGMLETIREYALEQLEAAGALASTRRRHAEYFVALAERAEPKLVTGEQSNWLDLLDADVDNPRAVLRWAQQGHDDSRPPAGAIDPAGQLGLRVAGALLWFWYMRGYWHEGRQWLRTELGYAFGLAECFDGCGRCRRLR